MSRTASRGRRTTAQRPHRPHLAQRTPDLNRFEPTSPIARRQVDELVDRGATVTQVRRNQVTLRRGDQVATVDGLGRVEWAS